MTTATVTPHAEVAAPSKDRSKLVGGISQAVVGAFGLWAFALGERTSSGADTIFGFSLTHGQSQVSVPAQATALTLSAIALACGLVRIFAPVGKTVLRWLSVLYIVCMVLAFLVWAAAGSSIGLNVPSILEQTAVATVPLVLGAMSALVSERSGIVNIAVEGQFLSGAFTAALTASMTGSVWVGLIAGMLAGAAMSSLLALFANRYMIEQVVLGVVINVLASGLTGFFYDRLMALNGAEYNTPPIFNALRIPGLASIPVIGPLFDQNIVFYAAFLSVPVLWFMIYRTRWGLRTRSIGEHPLAADTVGIKVLGLRYKNMFYAGLLSGLGGVWLTIGNTGQFGKDMSTGRGYIAIAALIVGNWSPVGAFAAAVMFGFALELQTALSPLSTPIPGAFLQMAPYLVTIFVVAVLGKKVRPPAAENKPFKKG
ncbi:ABC transporter permease [Actinospica sp. MGRD01-02]|uniref:ABC transporter permease n=1 Tax=Actinospica acidithermotolerans TaxID=2828514 RepID=A0A941IIY2_9ACTN|nr:ABC transporter permease [Actinospica acidithermotolerans]MBR7830145.1 ABC transporter permease [Actinospica acidithermotolerans]